MLHTYFRRSVKLFYQNIVAFVSLRCEILSCMSQNVLVTWREPFEAALPARVCTNYHDQIHADVWRGTWFKPRRNNSYCGRCAAVILRLEDAFETSFHIRHSLTRYLTLHNWQFEMTSNKYELTKAVRRNIIRHYKLTKQTIIVLTHQKIVRHCYFPHSAGSSAV